MPYLGARKYDNVIVDPSFGQVIFQRFLWDAQFLAYVRPRGFFQVLGAYHKG